MSADTAASVVLACLAAEAAAGAPPATPAGPPPWRIWFMTKASIVDAAGDTAPAPPASAASRTAAASVACSRTYGSASRLEIRAPLPAAPMSWRKGSRWMPPACGGQAARARVEGAGGRRLHGPMDGSSPRRQV